MRMYKCDICGSMHGGTYKILELPIYDRCEVRFIKCDVCEECVKKIYVFIRTEQEKHGMGAVRI